MAFGGIESVLQVVLALLFGSTTRCGQEDGVASGAKYVQERLLRAPAFPARL